MLWQTTVYIIIYIYNTSTESADHCNPNETNILSWTALSYRIVPYCFLSTALGVEFSTNNSSHNEFVLWQTTVYIIIYIYNTSIESADHCNPNETNILGWTALSYRTVPYCFLSTALGAEISTNNSSHNEFPVPENWRF